METAAQLTGVTHKQSDEFFKLVTVGKQTFGRYSQKALSAARQELGSVDMNAVWAAHKPTGRKK